MKNKILLSIVLISFLITNCKKENNNKQENTTYVVDSIQIFEDSAYSSTIKRNGNNWTSFNTLLSQNGSNFIKSNSNDTSFFKEPRYGSFAPDDIWYNSIDLQIKGNLPVYCKTIYNVEGAFGQYNAESDIYNWKYIDNRINEITKTYSKAGGLNSLSSPTEILRDSFTINYTGNTINKINFLARNIYNENDPTNNRIIGEYAIDFLYPNNKSNQKDLIGIDVNDLILCNKLLLGYFYFNFGYGVPAAGLSGMGTFAPAISFLRVDPETDILNNLSTYTNGDKLIENMHINNATIGIYGIDPIYGVLDLNASYIVDTNFNDRISEINISATATPIGFPAFIKTKKYKLFYHP